MMADLNKLENKLTKQNKLKFEVTMQPNGTLKNKLGITNAKELSQKEFLYSAKQMNHILKHPHKITNIDQLKVIHKHLFGAIYSWAGVVRNYDISKNGHTFHPYSEMNMAAIYVNNIINHINTKKTLTITDYANLLNVVNEMHPFREGNGRSAKCFLECLAINHHQFLQFDRDETEAIKGLNNNNVKLIAKHIHLEQLQESSNLIK